MESQQRDEALDDMEGGTTMIGSVPKPQRLSQRKNSLTYIQKQQSRQQQQYQHHHQQQHANGKTNNEVVIELNNTNPVAVSPGKFARKHNMSFMSWCKLILVSVTLAILLLYVSATTWTTLDLWKDFNQMFRIPTMRNYTGMFNDRIRNLTNEVSRLEQQINEIENHTRVLELEIDDIEQENDLYTQANDELSNNLTILSESNQQLSLSIQNYSQQNNILESSIEEIDTLNQNYSQQIIVFQQTNQDLNETIMEYETHQTALRNATENLSEILNQTTYIEIQYKEEQLRLTENVYNLSVTVDRLDVQVELFSNQTDELGDHLDTLKEYISFINDTIDLMEENYEDAMAIIDEHVLRYRYARIAGTQHLWNQNKYVFTNQMYLSFGGDQFFNNASAPLGDEYENILQWSNMKYLRDMCVDLDDFTRYFHEEVTPPNISTDEVGLYYFIQSLDEYRAHIDQYYYPFFFSDNFDENATYHNSTTLYYGPVKDYEWENANFKCGCLPPHRKFCYYGNCTSFYNQNKSEICPNEWPAYE